MSQAKGISIFFFILLFLPMAYSIPPVTIVDTTPSDVLSISYPIIDAIKQNSDYEFNFHVINGTNGLPIAEHIVCYFHLYNSTGGHQYEGQDATGDYLGEYSFYISGTNFSEVSAYTFLIQCNNSAVGSGVISEYFTVTPSGAYPDINATLWVVVIMVAMIFFFNYFAYTLEEEHLALKWFFRVISLIFIFVMFVSANVVGNSAYGYIAFTELFDLTIFSIIFWTFFAFFLLWILWKAFDSLRKKDRDDFDRGVI